MTHDNPNHKASVVLLGATGTIGRATAQALVAAGHKVTCPVRRHAPHDEFALPHTAEIVVADVTDPDAIDKQVFANRSFDVMVSCLASRNGRPDDAWAIDHKANVDAFACAKASGVKHIVYLSAICVQKPRLAFQHAKLAAENALIDLGVTYSIVRPTAFFKSLSGQIDRVKAGKRFLVFGDGTQTACKPISDEDLARYLVQCIGDPKLQNQILPIGGPGSALTQLDQARLLSDLLGRDVKLHRVPFAMINTIATGLDTLARIAPPLRDKAAFAKIGQYYATESMLVIDPQTGRYSAAATPEFGQDTLAEYYAHVLKGSATVERGEHSVFSG